MTGTVYLVGAGPGDPGLLTLRGAELLALADVVVHDRLTAPSLLSLAPPRAERIDVGKQPDDRGDQDAINELLVARARQGLRVVRLKGGDPFVFGRGGEEALALQHAGVPYEVVPGISSAVAAPAYAGVPVTHRGLVTSFTVVAGHSRSVDAPPEEGGTNWEALAATGGTIVVLMGAAHRGLIAARLQAAGMAPSTPVLAVQWGTEPNQRAVRTTLAELALTELSPPVTIVIGQVARLGLNWYGRRPLAGKTVVVTRAAHQAGGLSSRLRDLGARVAEVPVIEVVPPLDGGAALAVAAGRLEGGQTGAGGAKGVYEWAVFTSANAVERFFAHVPDTRALGWTKVAAVGPATAEALGRFRVVPDLVPSDYQAEGLLAIFPAPASAGRSGRAPGAPDPLATPDAPAVLLPQAAGSRAELAAGLAARGWRVDVVEAYRTVPRRVSADVLVSAAGADAICFASPSALNSYLDQAEAARTSLPLLVACIGPVTAAAARQRGLAVAVEASEHSIDGLVAELAAALGAPGPPVGRPAP